MLLLSSSTRYRSNSPTDTNTKSLSFRKIGNTQKVITTSGTNTYGITVTTRRCTVPNGNLKRIYDILQTKHQPFTKRKYVVHKLETKKTKVPEKQILLSG
jgi:hypothetical protein